MTSHKSYLIGMDLGTTNIKATLLASTGEVIATASRANDLIMPGADMVEQSPEQWWQNAVDILQDISQQAGRSIIEQVKGICISSQTVTMLPVNAKGEPLRNALIWMDARSKGQLDRILNIIGTERFINIVGGKPDVAFLPNKLLWYKENEPDLYDETTVFLQASSFLNYKLTGELTMDLDQAVRTQCLDLNTLSWSNVIGDAIGIPLNEMLPIPQPVDTIIGTVSENAALETGLVAGIPVAAGASDAMASMYATGINTLEQAGESSGTTSLVFIGHDSPSANNLPVVTKPCAIDGMPYVFDAPINTSGASIKWYLDTFCEAEKQQAKESGIHIYDLLNTNAASTPVGAHGILYFPYLLGERAPLWNTHARGMFIGMSLDASKNDFTRAIFEGTAFALKHVFDTVGQSGAKPTSLRITGGGAKSRTWCEIKASVLNMPVHILDEGSGDVPLGDALIIGHKLGIFPNLKETTDALIKVKEVIEPNPIWVEHYAKIYPYYIKMYQSLDEDLLDYQRTLDGLKA